MNGLSRAMSTRLRFYRRGAALAGRLILGAGILGLLGSYFYWSDLSEVRYRKYYNGMHGMIYGQQGVVDVALMGASRTQCMVGAREWGDALFGESAAQYVVYNLATSQRGKGFHYTVIRDLIEARKVARIIIDVNDTDKRAAYYVHPWYYLVARHRDIVRSVLFDTGRPWHTRVREGARIFLKKHASIVEDFLLGSIYVAPSAARSAARTTDHLPANPIRPINIARAMEGRQWSDLEAGFEWDLDAPLERRNTNFLEAIVKLAKQHRVKIDFLYVPKLMEPVLSSRMVAKLEARYGVRVLQPRNDQLRSLYPAAFADSGHGSAMGRQIFAELVAAPKQ
mgnify:CR=1 FL=1